MLVRLMICAALLGGLPACDHFRKDTELRSPCVGAEGSPCDRRPVNGPLNV
jgi:hypothetical protein